MTVGVAALSLSAFATVWAPFDPASDVVADGTDVAGASTSRDVEATTTSSTAPLNDLLAPSPTVVPTADISDGRAPLVHRVDTTDPVIFITIDDGHVRDPAYLDHFEQLGVPFTSFITEPYAKADPDY